MNLQLIPNTPFNNVPVLVGLGAYVLIEILSDFSQKSPLWLWKQVVDSAHRFFWGELRYLYSLKNEDRFTKSANLGPALSAIKAKPPSSNEEGKSLFDLLKDAVSDSQGVLVLGKPGSGKTTTLEALTYSLAQRAFQMQMIIWALFLGLIVLLFYLIVFHSLWEVALLFLILPFLGPVFDALFRRWPIPLFIELHSYTDGSANEFLKKKIAEPPGKGGNVLSTKWQSYFVDNKRLVLLLDGVNEVPEKAYDNAQRDWPSYVPVIFSSRIGGDPATLLGLKMTLEVLDLDDEGVRVVLQACGSQDVEKDFDALKRNAMLDKDKKGVAFNPRWLKELVKGNLHTCNQGAFFYKIAWQLIKYELDKSPVRPKVSKVPVDDELEALGYMAYFMTKNDKEELSQEDAREVLRGWREKGQLNWEFQQVLDEAEAAMLMRRPPSENKVMFTSHLLKRFFAAYYLRLNIDEAARHADDSRWWGALLMLGGWLEEREIPPTGEKAGSHTAYRQFVRAVLGDGKNVRRLFLAVELLRSVNDRDNGLADQVMKNLTRSLLEVEETEARQAAADLASIAGDGLVEMVGRIVQGEDQSLKLRAVHILEEIGSEQAADFLNNSLRDEAIAEDVLNALVYIGEPAIPPLLTLLQNEKSNVRQRAAKTLSEMGDLAIVPLAATLQKEANTGIWEATWALAQIGEPEAIEPLTALMQDVNTDDERRKAIAVALAMTGDTQGADLVIAALQDQRSWVLQSAARASGHIKEPRAVGPLIGMLNHNESSVREAAAWALGEIPDKQAVKDLIKMLSTDRDSDVLAQVVRSLGHIGEAEAVGPLLLPRLRKGEGWWMWKVHESVCLALGEIKYTPAVEPLTALLQPGDWFDPHTIDRAPRRNDMMAVDRAAIKALGQIGDAQAVESLVTVLSKCYLALEGNSDRMNRILTNVVVEALKQIGKSAIRPLIGLLEDPNRDRDVKLSAILGLGLIRDSDALPPLIQLLNSSNSNVRGRLAWALGQIGDEHAISPLIGLLGDEEKRSDWQLDYLEKFDWHPVSSIARKALEKIGEPAVDQLIEALKHNESKVRKNAALALGNIKDHRAVDPLIRKLRRDESSVREAAAGALGEIQDPQAIEPLTEMLKDPVSGLRACAARALGYFKDMQGLIGLQVTGRLLSLAGARLLEDVPGDESAGVRLNAVWALGQIGETWVVEPLTSAIGKNAPYDYYSSSAWYSLIREKVAQALGRIGDVSAEKPLVDLLEYKESSGVRANAAEALGRIKHVQPQTVQLLGKILEEDRYADVRKQAAWALGQIGESETVEVLIRKLQDSDDSVRQQAAESLGQIGRQEALLDLERVARKEKVRGNQDVANAARNSIKQIRSAQPKVGEQAIK